jgi:hypothetical protein
MALLANQLGCGFSASARVVEHPSEEEVRAEQRQQHDGHHDGQADEVPGEIQGGFPFNSKPADPSPTDHIYTVKLKIRSRRRLIRTVDASNHQSEQIAGSIKDVGWHWGRFDSDSYGQRGGQR